MDTPLLRRPSPAPMTASAKPGPKRPCLSSNGFSSSIDADLLLESFLGLSDSSLDRSFDRLLDSKASDSERNDVINRAFRLGSALVEAGRRSARARASLHNAVAWVLPSDLTIKVFSMLDTQSVCFAAAACSYFKNCADDPACYVNLDLITVVPRVNNAAVATMVHRAGKELQSLKLGCVPNPLASSSGSSQPLVNWIRKSTDPAVFSWNDKRSRQGKESSFLTRSCLIPLKYSGGTPGACLRRLHLYNIERLDNIALQGALLACPSLLDLEIVGLNVELRQTLDSVSRYCTLIERLFFESSKAGRDDSLKVATCTDLVNKCPHLSSLALRGFKLHDFKVRILVKGFRKLRYIDFSGSYSFTGIFLKNLGGIGGALLEALILRDCVHLKEVEVAKFLSAVLSGDFGHLKYLDISNREGLASQGDWNGRCYSSSFIPFKRLSVQKPDLFVVAEFPSDGDMNTESSSTPSHLTSLLESDNSMFASTTESSSYSSGSEEGFLHEESSDEVDSTSV